MNSAEAVLITRLEDAFSGQLCVSAWLGYGDVLFLGLGAESLPEQDVQGRRVCPPFELATHFAEWDIRGEATASQSHSARDDLEAAATSLVGERVAAWKLLDGNTLRVAFGTNRTLTVTPWPAEEGVSDAWSVRSPDGRLAAVSTDGRVAVIDADKPISKWFDAV